MEDSINIEEVEVEEEVVIEGEETLEEEEEVEEGAEEEVIEEDLIREEEATLEEDLTKTEEVVVDSKNIDLFFNFFWNSCKFCLQILYNKVYSKFEKLLTIIQKT